MLAGAGASVVDGVEAGGDADGGACCCWCCSAARASDPGLVASGRDILGLSDAVAPVSSKFVMILSTFFCLVN